MTAARETVEELVARLAGELGNPYLEHMTETPVEEAGRYTGVCRCGWTSSRSYRDRGTANRSAGLHAGAAVKRADRLFDQRLAAELELR